MADVRAMIEYKEALVTKVYDVSRKNLADFMPRVKKTYKSDFTNDVLLDPDNILNKEHRSRFETLCQEFQDIIQYSPGTYNGAYGLVKNTIELTSIPPPNNKCYVPKYSKAQTDRLAEKWTSF